MSPTTPTPNTPSPTKCTGNERRAQRLRLYQISVPISVFLVSDNRRHQLWSRRWRRHRLHQLESYAATLTCLAASSFVTSRSGCLLGKKWRRLRSRKRKVIKDFND
ncbi:hypothetical protein ACLB2K_050818 [Fragaria x ananassa]